MLPEPRSESEPILDDDALEIDAGEAVNDDDLGDADDDDGFELADDLEEVDQLLIGLLAIEELEDALDDDSLFDDAAEMALIRELEIDLDQTDTQIPIVDAEGHLLLAEAVTDDEAA